MFQPHFLGMGLNGRQTLQLNLGAAAQYGTAVKPRFSAGKQVWLTMVQLFPLWREGGFSSRLQEDVGAPLVCIVSLSAGLRISSHVK